MKRRFPKIIASYLMLFALAVPVLVPLSAQAQTYEGVREMHWDSDTKRCEGGGWQEPYVGHPGSHRKDVLQFDPFGSNEDINWEFSNGACASFMSGVGALMLAAGKFSESMCVATNPLGAGRISAEFVANRAANADLPVLTPGILVSTVLRGTQCASRSVEYATLATAGGPASPGAILAAADVARCCPALGSYVAAVSASVVTLGIMYGVAQGAYKKARICGHDWLTWDKVNANNEHDDNGTWVRSNYSDSHKYQVENKFKPGGTAAAADFKLSNADYREYIFGGVEFKDSGPGACKNPSWSGPTRNATLGYDDDNQRYYVTGPGLAPVFACYRFLMARGSDADLKAGQAAYDCCTKRSQSTVCIENAADVAGPASTYDHVFCEIGSRCNVNGVWFDAYASREASNYACAKTYSACPYNHPLGGGTETADYSDPNDLASKTNYCQHMAHCSKLPIKPYVVQSSLEGGYFDSSCKDLKGDSQNVYGYESNLLPINNRGFSAPMAQCFKETMQNVFFNTAGHSECNDSTERANVDGVCKSGYKYKEGDNLAAYQKSLGQSGDSFFVKVQNGLQSAVKMALTISIILFGAMALIGATPITKKQLLPYVVKIALVMYFAVGDGWQANLMNGIVGSSTQLAQMMFGFDPNDHSNVSSTTTAPAPTGRASTDSVDVYTTTSVAGNTGVTNPSKLDGCQFPKFNYADSNEATKYDYPAYPPGKDYLVIWDTLDCKIARALGFGIEVSVPNLVMMIAAGLFTGGAGVVFFIATFVFAFFLIAMTIRALHIFLMSVMVIVILSYVSPIMVTLVMFNKTKGMFEKWWKQILGFALQPMILFAYLGVMLTIFDNVVIGDATFRGDGKGVPKQIVCEGAAKDTSIYCIFNPPVLPGTPSTLVKTYDELKMLGIGLPVLAEINQTKITSLMKAAILLFILSQFLDQITGLAKELVGGEALTSNSMSAAAMIGKAGDVARGIQKRGAGMLRKNVAPALMSGGGAVLSGLAALGSKGKTGAGSGGAVRSGANTVGSTLGAGSSTSSASTPSSNAVSSSAGPGSSTSSSSSAGSSGPAPSAPPPSGSPPSAP